MSDEIDLLAEEEERSSEPTETSEETNGATSSTVSIGIIGDASSPLTVGTKTLLSHKNNIVFVSDDIDQVVERQNDIVIFCEDIKLLDNDTLDDARLLSACRKVETHTKGSFIIRSAISPDTISKIVSCGISEDFWDKKIVYWPDLNYNLSVEKMFDSPVVLGGQREACQGLYGFLEFQSNLMNLEVARIVSMIDASFVKLTVSGYYGLIQTYANQLFEVVNEYEGTNYTLIRHVLSTLIENPQKEMLVPVHVRSKDVEDINVKRSRSYKGEYGNNDIRIFASLSDRIPVIDECVNYKNTKG